MSDASSRAWHRQQVEPIVQEIATEALEKVVEGLFNQFAGDQQRLGYSCVGERSDGLIAFYRMSPNEFMAASQVEPLLLAWLDVLGSIF